MENTHIFSPGSILINTTTNKLYGVLVSLLTNNKIIVFRLDKNTHPIFSKFELHPNIAKVGIINEYQYSNLKSALLKHYRTYNLTITEKQMLQPLMNFAFPLGIPEYQPDVELPERDIQLMDLNSKLSTGCRILLNTPQKSTCSHLNGKIASILDKTPTGIWVHLPSSEQDLTKLNNSLSFLFYKNPEIPTFSGISRMMPLTDEPNELSNVLQEAFHNLKENDSLTTTMEFNGDKIRVMPKTMKIIFPEVYSGMTYNPHNDTFIADPNIITPELSKKLGTTLMVGGKDKKGNMMEQNGADNDIIFNPDVLGYGTSEIQPDIKIDGDGELLFEGGARKTKLEEIDKELSNIDVDDAEYSRYSRSSDNSLNESRRTQNIDDIVDIDTETIDIATNLKQLTDDDIDLKDLLYGTTPITNSENPMGLGTDADTDIEDADGNKSGRTSATGDETDYNEDEIVEIIGEDEIGDVEIIEKVKVVEVDEIQKVYPESVQKGDLRTYKLEKIPPLLRTDEIQNKIIKQINIISLLKHSITDDDNNIKFQPQDYKPLVHKYLKGDYTNKFLIPLVINKKKIYLDNDKQNKQDEYDSQTHTVNDNYYGNIANMIYLQDKKNVSLNNDAYINNIITEMNPTVVNEEDNLGLLFRLGSEIANEDYNKLIQDTLTVKYCDKNMKCQSYSLNTMNFDYQVNLGPMGRFIEEEEETPALDIDEEEEKFDKDILYLNPRFKIYYQGDLIRIIGYIRPPLEYFNIIENGGIGSLNQDTLLSNMYELKKSKNEVVSVNLEDINPEIIDEDNDQFDITIHPDKFVLFLLPNNIEWNNLEPEINKIIPSIDDIIKLYLNKKTNNTIEYIYDVLNKFDYDTNSLTLDIHDKMIEKNQQLRDIYIKFNEELSERYNHHKEKMDKLEHNAKHSSKSLQLTKDDKKFKYIPDTILEDISKFYFETYENKGISVDADDIRLRWFMNSFDNGRYFFKTLFINYLKNYESLYKIENLETELSIIKDKHAMAETNQLVANTGGITGASSSTGECGNKTTSTTPNIIKYPNLARLEQDNGKVAVDSEGNVIMAGDYALVDVEGSKQLYKREIIANVDMWIKEDIALLYKLIQDKKNKCTANPEMKLEDANKCAFDMENIKCEVNDIFDATKQKLDMEKTIADLQKQIDYIKHIPVLIATINKEISDDRTVLLNKLNSMKHYWKHKEEEEAKLEEYIKKTIVRNKECVHFGITDYFFKIGGYSDDRYQFARSIFRNFLNVETQFDHDYNVFDRTSNDNNFTYCNICNQKLLCNHIRLGVSYIENDLPIDYDKIITIYTEEVNGGYYCRACDEFVGNTDVLDLDDFAKGEDGFRNKTRELAENTPLIEKQKQYIDSLIQKAVEGDPDAPDAPNGSGENLQQKINIFRLLKRICGLDVLSILDEVEMLNFLKSFTFTRKNDILQALIIKYGTGNVAMLRKQMEQLYLIYLCCDIGARFLIILQTTKTPYELRNKDCNTNIIGYPLISDMGENAGTNFIICLLGQMSILPDYMALANMKPSMFMDRVRKQVEEDNFVKARLYNAVNNIAEEIDYMYEFQNYKTNYWKTFIPRLEHIQIKWTPEKILNDANLREVSAKNWHRMIEVGNENCTFYALNIINDINRIIDNSDKVFLNIRGNATSCCPETHITGENYNYLKYFTSQNSNINKNLKQLNDSTELLTKLYDIKRISLPNILYEPLYKPSQTTFGFNLEATQDEIRDIYLKFIETGFNRGKLHIFDKYGRCILSNENKADIAQKSYSQQDYKRIEDAITSTNQIDTKTYTTELELQKEMQTDQQIQHHIYKLEMKTITDLVSHIPKFDTMHFLEDYMKTMVESFPHIFNFHNATTRDSQTANKNRKTAEQFNIHHHLSMLNAQIETEINHLVQKITTTDKLINKYSSIMSNLGYYKQQYEEYKKYNEDNETKGDIFRYNKKEESIQNNLKYLNDAINQIKNQKLANPLNRDKIRPQFRDFLQFGENIKLFKLLDKSTREIYDFAQLFKSKNKFKILFPEMVSSILHYLLVISLANLFDVVDNNKIGKNKTDIIDFKFKQPVDKDPALADYQAEMDIALADDDAPLDEDGQPIDLIESFEFKNNTNLKVVGEFIITYLDKVYDTQNTYDELTNDYVNLIVTKDKQKDIENTLRTFEWLNMETHEDIYQLTMMKMRMKKVNYGNIYQYIRQEQGDEFLDEENDEYIGEEEAGEGDEDRDDEEEREDGERGNNEYGMDKYELENEFPQVVGMEDLEDGDMDYDFIGVDEG